MRAPHSAIGRRCVLATVSLLTACPPTPPAAIAEGDAKLLLFPEGSRMREAVENSLRPPIRAWPRGRLTQDFAVLLMRSSYAVADELDFMAMNEFQREQFLLRQREWDVYKAQLPKVTQGDLSDPAYFDFMSFCQYASIASGMRRGKLIFEETVDAEGSLQVVRRDLSLPQTNAELPAEHAARVGDRIIDWMAEKYPNLAPVVATAVPSSAMLLEGISKIQTIFEINEFCLTSSLVTLPGNSGVAWTLVTPATLWSGQVLRLRGDLPNDFEAMAVMAYLRRCGIQHTCSTRYEKGTQVTHEFRWLPSALAA